MQCASAHEVARLTHYTQNEIATHIREQSRQYMHSVANVAMQWAREKYTLSETLRDARKRIDTLQYASTSKDLMINTIAVSYTHLTLPTKRIA